jgi:hypothetical protein
MKTGAKDLCGRAFAQTGAVTLDTNVVSNNCSSFDNGSGRSDFGSAGFTGGGVLAIPEPGTIALLSAGFLGLATLHRYRRDRRSHPKS